VLHDRSCLRCARFSFSRIHFRVAPHECFAGPSCTGDAAVIIPGLPFHSSAARLIQHTSALLFLSPFPHGLLRRVISQEHVSWIREGQPDSPAPSAPNLRCTKSAMLSSCGKKKKKMKTQQRLREPKTSAEFATLTDPTNRVPINPCRREGAGAAGRPADIALCSLVTRYNSIFPEFHCAPAAVPMTNLGHWVQPQ